MRLRTPLTIGFGVAVVLSIAADAASKQAIDSPSDAPVLRGRKARPGSAIALADFKGTTIALVADEDDGMIRVFDAKAAREIGSSRVPGVPAQVVVTRSGKVLVALRDKGQVAILEAKGGDARNLVQRGSIDTGGEPVAISTTPDESTLVVASGWTHEVLAYNLADRTLKFRTNVSREPRSIAVASDGSKAYVTHAVGGALSTVDLSTGSATANTMTATSPSQYGNGAQRTRYGTQGFAIAMNDSGKVFAPTVFADPNAQETYYGAGVETLGVAVLDEVSGTIAPSTQQVTAAAYGTLEKCILPRAAAVTGDGKRLVVGCAGDTDLLVLDATAASPRTSVLRTRSAGDSIAAIAIDDATDSAVTWSQHGRTLSIVSLGEKGAKIATANASGGTLSAAAGRGRRIFHAVDGRMAADGRACASCHTDGRDDGLTWNTPEGARQTPMLAGRLSDTAPYGWTRDAKTFHEYVRGTVQRLRGKGFTNDELNDLSAYVMTLKAPPKSHADDATVKKGAEVFAAQGCASCHAGAATTDGKRHPIEALPETATRGAAGSFATPSLRFVGETAPYFHDGRYPTLRALLTSSDKLMGKGRDLPSSDIDALEAYLKTL